MSNWMKVDETPCVTKDCRMSILAMPETASSMGRVIWLSSSAGAAPGWATVTTTAGNSMSGNCFTGSMK